MSNAIERTNRNPAMATNRQPWTPPQNRHIVALAFALIDGKADGTLDKRGAQSALCRAALARINAVGPDRTSYRPDGKPRADSLNFKLQNVAAILATMGRPETIPGLPPLKHTQTEKRDPLADPFLWREIEITLAIRDAAAAAETGTK